MALNVKSIESHLRPFVIDETISKEILYSEMMDVVESLTSQADGYRYLIAQKYRSSSESVSPNQLALSLLTHMTSDGDTNEETADKEERDIEVLAHTRKRKTAKRKTDLSNLNRKVVELDLAEHERMCDCCDAPKKDMGFDTSETLEFTPPSVFVLEERTHNYSCPRCKEGVVKAEGSGKVIPGSVVSPSILAHIMTSKFLDSMPFYRQSKQFERFGVHISDKLLGEWFLQGADLLMGFQEVFNKDLLQSHLISFDDTPFKIQDLKRDKNIKLGRVWIYLGDQSRVALAKISPDWKGTHPLKVLEGFTDTLQHDGYAGINPIYKGIESPIKAGCMDHARRKFVKALDLGDERAAAIVVDMAKLYEIERRIGEQDLGFDDITTIRQEQSVPIMEGLDLLVDKATISGKSRTYLAKAVTYFARQREALGAFLADGRIPISNIHVEQIMRIIALLRKNALFFGSDEATQKYAVILTLLLNAALAGVNPFEYLKHLFEMIANGCSAKELHLCTPKAWAKIDSG